MKKYFVILFFLSYPVFSQNRGVLQSDFKQKMSYVSGLLESTANPTIRGVGSIPINYSLEQYLPEIGDQGSTPSCVGWSTTYYALTIIKRLEKGKSFSPMNPWSPYNRHQTRKFKTGCNSGCWIEDVLLILQNEGCPTYEDYDFKYCAQDSTRKIYSEKLFGWSRISNSRNQIKSALINNFPVVVGVDVMGSYEDGSMLSSKYIDKEGVLKLNMFESSSLGGGHAMCIVGYNDTLMGGAFKIVNSWGKDWGKNGFCWLRYGDLKYVSQAFYLRSNSIEARSEKEMFLTNNFNFINSTDSSIYISLAYNDNKSQMSSRGWFEVAPGGCRSINLSDRSKNDFYWMAVDYSGKPLSPECGGKCLDFFVDLHHAYEYSSSQKTDSLDKASFLNYMPLNKNNAEDIIIETIRGNNRKIISHKLSDEKRDFKDYNLNWDGEGPLLDPLTHEVIIRNPDTKEKFTVYIFENNQVKEIKANVKKLKKLNTFKFLRPTYVNDFHLVKN